MKLTLKHAIAAIILVLTFTAPVMAETPEERAVAETKASKDIFDAAMAGLRGDHETERRVLRQYAEKGHAPAQYFLGDIYYRGEAVPQDYAEAAKWFRLSADQGNIQAQYYLGKMYFLGQGVPQDYVRAHMWFNITLSIKDEPVARSLREQCEVRMTPAQLAEAQKLAREWKPTTQTPR